MSDKLSIQEYANHYNSIGLSVLPVGDDKRPIVSTWKESEHRIIQYDFSRATSIALVGGKVSGNIEVIDFDTKYDLTGKLMQNYKTAVKEVAPDLLDKLLWQQSPSGGFHAIYRCERFGGSQKLARRPATQEEMAKKAGEKVKVLIETKAEGGYVLIYPSTNYKVIKGTFDNIPTITIEERELLLQFARNENLYFKDDVPYKVKKMTFSGKSPFEDYNDRGDCVGLLEKHGWRVVKEQGSKIQFVRPGDTSAVTSGNFDRDKNWFSVFSTSTPFENERAYLPYAVYTVLECNGDFSEAAKKLSDEGYGEKKVFERQHDTVSVKSSIRKDKIDFIAGPSDYDEYITNLINGTVQLGLTTGMPEFDEFWRFKREHFNVINGHDNVGKSIVLWYFCLLAAMYHDWNSIIYSGENKPGGIRRKLIEFYWGIHIRNINSVQRRIAEKFIDDHFTIIKNDVLYNYREILDIADICEEKRKHDIFLIDPYNNLSIDIPKGSGMNMHDYHYVAASEIKMWGKQNDCCVYLNTHAVTSAARIKEDGHPAAPHKADTEGGIKFSSKSDDFWTIHRLVYDDVQKYTTQIHIRKVRETETGGTTTDAKRPFLITLNKTMCIFTTGSGYDPIKAWRDKEKQIEIDVTPAYKSLQPSKSWTDSAAMKEQKEPIGPHVEDWEQ